MATSSFDKHFVINDPKAVEQLIYSMENPTPVHLPKKDREKEEKEALCLIDKLLHLAK